MEFCVVCDRRTTLAFHVCSGRAIYSIGPQGSYDMSAETLTSLAWVGDAEITLFVREALLARGIMDTGYFQELTSGEAQVAMYNLLSKEDRTQWCYPQMRPGPKGKRKSGDFLSTLYEALWASDFHFRKEAQALLIAYIRARTGPFGGDFLSLKQVASGPVVTNSHLWRLNSRSPLTGSLRSTSCRKVVTEDVYAILGSEQFTIHGSSLDQFKKCVLIGSKSSSDTVFTRILKYWSNGTKQR